MIHALVQNDTPYVIGYCVYAVTTIAIIYGLRAIKSTWQKYDVPDPKRPARSGSRLTLPQAAMNFLSNLCPSLLLAATLILWIVRGYVGQSSLWDLAIVIGSVVMWPFTEWVVHVFLLHMKPIKLLGRTIEPIFIKTHRSHHRNPWDPRSGLASPYVIAMYALGLPLLWGFALPLPQALTGSAVSVALLLNYEWLHYLIHTTYRPASWLFKRLWINHRLHHFRNENYWYGVTTLSADVLLHTRPGKEAIPNSDTCTNFGIEAAVEELA